MHQVTQLGAGSSVCSPPGTHAQPHSCCEGRRRQGHPYQEALLAEFHLTVGWLSQQIQQQGEEVAGTLLEDLQAWRGSKSKGEQRKVVTDWKDKSWPCPYRGGLVPTCPSAHSPPGCTHC